MAETVPLTLIFAKAGNISLTVPVKALGASQNSQGTMSGMGIQANNGHDGEVVMRARHWVFAAMVGVGGFAVGAVRYCVGIA